MKAEYSYDTDFYAWANEQAKLLRAGRLTEIDIENIAEELESLGKSEKKELHNRLVVLLAHLLKWQLQPNRRTTSWEVTIRNQRLDITDHLDENPSLRTQLDEAIAKAYLRAIGEARKQTRLEDSDCPAQCPYTQAQIFDPGFWPPAAEK